ncbi:MAG: hypothetical protein U0903_00165 [Planctomycetales bacterium]
MVKHLLAFALTAMLTQNAFAQFPGFFSRGTPVESAPVVTSTPPSAGPNSAPPPNASSGTGVGAWGSGEPFYPWDAPEPWVHGRFQEMPAYGGYHYFKPYNYRHVMPQSQVAAGWGMPATMPYSQGFFRAREYAQQDSQRLSQMQSQYVQELARMQFLLEQERMRNQHYQPQQPRGGYEATEVPQGNINTISGRR